MTCAAWNIGAALIFIGIVYISMLKFWQPK